MKIKLNPDKEMVKTVREGLKRTGGYCPCMLERSPDTKCMCKAFREQKELAQAFGIASIPTLLVIRDGRTVNRAVGVRSKEEILQMLD